MSQKLQKTIVSRVRKQLRQPWVASISEGQVEEERPVKEVEKQWLKR